MRARLRRIVLLVGALCAFRPSSAAFGETYYVNPSGTCSDDNAGTSRSAPWCTPPGTRTTDASGLLSGGTWGTVSGTNRVACGDVILLYPGAKHTSARGGAWCLAARGDPNSAPCNNEPAERLYQDCTAANPVTIKIATPAEWPGAPATGHFTIDGTGMTGTQAAAFGRDALVAIGHINGLTLRGLDTTRRIILNGPQYRWSGSADGVSVILNSSGGDELANRDIVLEWISAGNTSFGFLVAAVDNYRFSNLTVSNTGGHCVIIGNQTNKPSGHGVWENVDISDCGETSIPFQSDGLYVHNASRAWFVNWTIHDTWSNGGQTGHVGGYPNNPGQSRTYRMIFRNLVTYGAGRSANQNAQAGFGGDGDGDIAYPHSYQFHQGTRSYGNQGNAIWTPHGSGRAAYWHLTTYLSPLARAGDRGIIGQECYSDATSFFNSIFVPQAGGAAPWDLRTCSTTPINVKPYVSHVMIPWATGPSDVITRGDYTEAWPSAGGARDTDLFRRFKDVASWNFLANKAASQIGNVDPRFVTVTNGNCDNPSNPTYADCDFRLCEGVDDPAPGCSGASTAIDAGTFFLRAKGAGATPTSTMTVKPGDGDSTKCRWGSDPGGRGNCGVVGEPDPDLVLEYGDPRNFFLEPATCPGCVGDVIQIQGATCANAREDYGSPQRARVVSMTASTITLDRACTWSDNAGVHRQWGGNGPDLGALESGGASATPTTSSTTTTSTTTTIPTTSSTTTSTTTTTTLPRTAGQALYTAEVPPQVAGSDDPIELGVRFTVSQPAVLTAVRAYLASQPESSYPVALYRADTEALVDSGSFTGSGTGWHEAVLAGQPPLEPGVPYVATYHTPHGGYGVELEAFSQDRVAGILTAFAATPSSPNGVYRYGLYGSMPTLGDGSTSYYVTPVVTPVPPPNTTACIDPMTGLERTPSAIRVRRFSLSGVGDVFDVRANGRFSYPGGLDLGISGLTLFIEDASGRLLFHKVVRGADLVPSRLGWRLASELDELPHLAIEAGSTGALVSMRCMLPAADLLEASETVRAGSGTLRWLVRFGDECRGVAPLSCRTTVEGNLSCDLQ